MGNPLLEACEMHERKAEELLHALDVNADQVMGVEDVRLWTHAVAPVILAHTALAAHYYDRLMRG